MMLRWERGTLSGEENGSNAGEGSKGIAEREQEQEQYPDGGEEGTV